MMLYLSKAVNLCDLVAAIRGTWCQSSNIALVTV